MPAQLSQERVAALQDLFARIEHERRATLEQMASIIQKERATILLETSETLTAQRKAIYRGPFGYRGPRGNARQGVGRHAAGGRLGADRGVAPQPCSACCYFTGACYSGWSVTLRIRRDYRPGDGGLRGLLLVREYWSGRTSNEKPWRSRECRFFLLAAVAWAAFSSLLHWTYAAAIMPRGPVRADHRQCGRRSGGGKRVHVS